MARAELARQETEIGTTTSASLDNVRAEIRAAIVGLKQLDDDLASEIRRRTRPVDAAGGTLSDAELASLEANARYQLARGFRNQALAYPAESNDRINALTQAIELLAPLGKASDDDPLAWPSRVEEIVCLRQVGKLAEATHRLAELESSTPPAAYSRRLRAKEFGCSWPKAGWPKRSPPPVRRWKTTMPAPASSILPAWKCSSLSGNGPAGRPTSIRRRSRPAPKRTRSARPPIGSSRPRRRCSTSKKFTGLTGCAGPKRCWPSR